jgi:hypothetical protein
MRTRFPSSHKPHKSNFEEAKPYDNWYLSIFVPIISTASDIHTSYIQLRIANGRDKQNWQIPNVRDTYLGSSSINVIHIRVAQGLSSPKPVLKRSRCVGYGSSMSDSPSIISQDAIKQRTLVIIRYRLLVTSIHEEKSNQISQKEPGNEGWKRRATSGMPGWEKDERRRGQLERA